MSEYMMKVEWEQVDAIVISELKYHHKTLGKKSSIPLFSFDEKEEKKEVAKLRKALKIVLDFWGEKV